MLKQRIKRAGLAAARGTGLVRAVAASNWRRERLLIWCFHGISLRDEHEWRPPLFLDPKVFERRLELMTREGYQVLSLAEGIEQLHEGSLERPSVALTFDDGFADFYLVAAPILERFGYPATVYLTTYYATHHWPIFGLICSYIVWKRAGTGLDAGEALGLDEKVRLDDPDAAADELERLADERGLSGEERNEWAQRLAKALEIDWDDLLESRLLQVMTPEETTELSRRGFDIQLHTHRHRTPDDEALYKAEIEENRGIIEELTRRPARHFCYPSGVWSPKVWPWLEDLGIETATTCDHGLTTRNSDPLALPRYVDRSSLTDDEMKFWLSGMSALVRKSG